MSTGYCLACKTTNVEMATDWACVDCMKTKDAAQRLDEFSRKRVSTRLAGHSLIRVGTAYHIDGCQECRPGGPDRFYGGMVSAGYGGHGRCICGDASPCVDTVAARRRWHAQHKDQVRALQQARAASDHRV